MSLSRELSQLLLGLFSVDELKIFVSYNYSDLSDWIAWNQAPSTIVHTLVEKLARRGDIDGALFGHLHRERPGRSADIERVQRLVPTSQSTGEEPRSDAATDQVWWESKTTDWTRGEPKEALELLADAYEDRPDVRALAKDAGLHWAKSQGNSAYDLLRWALEAAARMGRTRHLIASVLSDPSRAAHHDDLRALLGDYQSAVDAATVARYDAESIRRSGGKPLESVSAWLGPEPGQRPVEGLQAITDPSAGWDDPHAILAATINAMRRTAMIEVNGRPAGTGFLIGPDLMLTAGHVVQKWPWRFTDPSGATTAVFDFYTGRKSDAETGSRVRVVELVAGLPPDPGERDDGTDYDWEGVTDYHLDFALLRLDRRVSEEHGGPGRHDPGDPRGHYALHSEAYPFDSAPMLFMAQHPLGQRQVHSRMKPSFEVNPTGTRCRYRGNSLMGSSGSAVLDERGRLVAVHHYSDGRSNQGVPVSAICRALDPRILAELTT